MPKTCENCVGKMAGLCAQTGHFYIINRHAKFVTVFNFSISIVFCSFFAHKRSYCAQKMSSEQKKLWLKNVWFVATRETMCLVGLKERTEFEEKCSIVGRGLPTKEPTLKFSKNIKNTGNNNNNKLFR